MSRSLLALFLLAAFPATARSEPETVPRPKAPPNIVVLLADDLGWSGTGVYGSSYFETPAIDRLAAEGMLFTDAYAAAPVCTPSRVALLTGQYPATLRMTHILSGVRRKRKPILAPKYEIAIPKKTPSLASSLKEAGYATATIGKWHAGAQRSQPKAYGFDLNVGGNSLGGPGSYFPPYGVFQLRPPKGKPKAYLTDTLTDAAVEFMQANRERPFLLYLSYFQVHTPLEAKPELEEKYAAKVGDHPGQTAVYGAMTQSLDESVQQVLAALDELDLRERTVVFLTSDNGALEKLTKGRGPVTTNAPLRGGKGKMYEGGIRVPFLVRWPGAVEPGTTCPVPISGVDLYPTVLDIAGLPIPDPVQGESLVPLLKQEGALKRDAIYWHFPHYSSGPPTGAVRAGRYKLIEFYEDGNLELYDLSKDVGETTDLAGKEKEKSAELKGLLDAWREAVDAAMPTPNPKYEAGK